MGELPGPGTLLAGPDPALRRLHQEDLHLELPVGLVLRQLLQRLLARWLLLRLRLCRCGGLLQRRGVQMLDPDLHGRVRGGLRRVLVRLRLRELRGLLQGRELEVRRDQHLRAEVRLEPRRLVLRLRLVRLLAMGSVLLR